MLPSMAADRLSDKGISLFEANIVMLVQFLQLVIIDSL